MVAIEIDGISHDYPEKFIGDKVRQERIEELGVRFVRINDVEVKKNLPNVILYLDDIVRRVKAG